MTHPYSFVEKLRLVELDSAIQGRIEACTMLEIGAGTGWQARELHRRGFRVEAVDIPDGTYTHARIWPVQEYDGRHLPFADDSFDLVFSSNVLEHVIGLPELLAEQLRVLKRGGWMIHVVPSASWRFWTSLSYYPNLARRIGRRMFPARSRDRGGHKMEPPAPTRRRTIEKLWAPVHGTAGSPFEEMLQFRRSNWLRVFASVGLHDVTYWPAGLFYSGHLVIGEGLSIGVRRILSRLLGSSCHVFAIRKP